MAKALLEMCGRLDLRQVANQLETALINPLARALFTTDVAGRDRIVVADIAERDKVYTVTLAQ